MLRRHILFALLVIGFTGPAMAQNGSSAPGPYRIVATTGMIADIVRHVAGDRAAVTGLIGEGIDPHLYRPTRQDLIRLQQADVIFYNGLKLEGRMTDVLQRLARQKPVYAVTTLVRPDELLLKDDEEETFDPHLWMDVTRWMLAVRAVADALGAHHPEHEATYQANAAAYLEQLAALDAYVRTVIDTVAPSRRVLITAHDAFGYFGREYGMEVLGIQGISTESETSIREMNELVALVVERGIDVIFIETSVPDKNVMAIIEGAASHNHRVRVGGELFSDAMGPTGSYQGTYIGMIDHNATTIAGALGGTVPEGGMQGKLKAE